MISSPRKRRQRLIVTLVVVVIAIGAFVGLLCRGPTGLFSILTQKRVVTRLQREIGEMKDSEALFRSDIKNYHDPARVKKIAREKYGIGPKQDEALNPAQPGPARADSGKR